MSITPADSTQRQNTLCQMSLQRDAGINISEIVHTTTREFFLSFAQCGVLLSKENKLKIRQIIQDKLSCDKQKLFLDIYRKELSDTPLSELTSKADQIEQQNKNRVIQKLQSAACEMVQLFIVTQQLSLLIVSQSTLRMRR